MANNVVRVKDGVQFAIITPGGFAILAALAMAARAIAHDLTIIRGTDGDQSGPEDCHPRGEAYDVKSKGLPDKLVALKFIQNALPHYLTHFYAFLEDEGTEGEHFHVQVKKGSVYP